MTNVMDLHTFTTSSVDLVLAVVFLLHGHLLELVGDVVGGTTVDVPVGVDPIGATGSRSNLFFILRGVTIIFLVAVPTVFRRVTRLATNLAVREVRTRSVGAATTAPFCAARAPAAAGVVGEAAATAATGPPLATRGGTRARAATAASGDRVGRGPEAAAATGAVKLRHTLIKVAKHSEKLIKGYRSDSGVQGGDEGLIVLVQPMDDVGYELIVLDRFSRRGELISKPPHGGEEGGH